ncbi:cytochrome c oxidase assembly protein [Dactylosporangium roseum]|uniref:Cytochrome c oxidase assembly protein n=1 Tax=Dactylosporangium roseum TaxID=47989 RepID=A0ABY5Z4F5_9ACTN|nr:cytochrome c oxidase assembly protein [Dactylosporangium roseum]UWZ35324.1 cytochrome c oxidase assembly protein [Dactylosporangium roseum]
MLHAAEPGPPSASTILGSFHVSWLTLVLLTAAGLYLAGVLKLRKRGDTWPVARTVLFLLPGLGSIAAVTMTGIERYDTTLLSVHMIQHMMLSMIAPIFLALGAPVTLALRTLPGRGRRTLLAVVHSRVARVMAFPLVAFGMFVVTPFVLYFTNLYELTMRHAWIHELTHAHFIAVGCLFFWPLIGLDPLPGRWPYPARALLMFLSTPFHTVLGLTIMQSKDLLGGDWYPSLRLGWTDPAGDQVVAGGILWAGGEIVSVTMLAVLVVQWMRQSDREAKRVDRQLDREERQRREEAEWSARTGIPMAADGTIPEAPATRGAART